MAHTPEDNDPLNWHRHFAIESNNRAWELSVAARTGADDEEMLNVAHASALHWQVAGDELNHMRARMLLADVHASLGLGSTALAYARQMKDYFLNRETDDWELAFTHVIHAHAAHAAGEMDEFARAYTESLEAIEAIVAEEDREIVMQTFEHVPHPPEKGD